jgi:hypothetical protein
MLSGLAAQQSVVPPSQTASAGISQLGYSAVAEFLGGASPHSTHASTQASTREDSRFGASPNASVAVGTNSSTRRKQGVQKWVQQTLEQQQATRRPATTTDGRELPTGVIATTDQASGREIYLMIDRKTGETRICFQYDELFKKQPSRPSNTERHRRLLVDDASSGSSTDLCSRTGGGHAGASDRHLFATRGCARCRN